MANKYKATDPFTITKKMKHQVTIAMAKMWRTQYSCEFQSLTWFKYSVNDQDKTLVKVLWCRACTKFDSSIRGMKNYFNTWITGSTITTGQVALLTMWLVNNIKLLCLIFALRKIKLGVAYCQALYDC